MPLDGVTAKCLAGELNDRLADARVDRIVQPDRYDVILQLRRDSANYRLIFSANPSAPRVHLTTENRDNPSVPPMFCMLLRKHLLGARLLSLSTPGYERIFELVFDTINEIGDHQEKRLVVEIMGRHSNIILLNRDGRIHDAILHVDASISRVREIMPARLYTLPPDQAKRSPADVADLLQPGGAEDSSGLSRLLGPVSSALPLGKALLESLQGFSPQLCQEVLTRADLDSRLKPADLSTPQLMRLSQSLRQLCDTILAGHFSPSLFFNGLADNLPVDFHALPLQGFAVCRPAGDVSAAMDAYYLERNRNNSFLQKKQSLAKIVSNQLDHARKKLATHEADREEGAAYAEYRRRGDLILANLQAIEPEQASIQVIDYGRPEQPTVQVPLQENLTASQNAQRYFKRYTKAKVKFETASRMAAEDQREIVYLESLVNALDAASDPIDLQALRQEILAEREPGSQASDVQAQERSDVIHPGKAGSRKREIMKSAAARAKNRSAGSSKNTKGSRNGTAKKPAGPAPLPPRRYTSSDGLTILVGRNNLQNDQLTLKTAQKNDLWLHVQRIPGTHVIVQANQQPVPDATLQEAAGIAAWFSRAAISLPEGRKAPEANRKIAASSIGGAGLKVAVDYCPASHVRKPSGARPGMVIYEHYQTIIVSPLDPHSLVDSAEQPSHRNMPEA